MSIEERIGELQKELKELELRHQHAVKQFQQMVAANQVRYAQIQGALIELKKFAENESSDEQPNDFAKRVLDHPVY